ncbi:hypothetical protein PILCRDRAFT_219284 [Piloderma croceum F 1598]|uniref:Metallo-beta-lactamase domain-containing protein n=1 Tax=Piloderma croceum (strain F 1598) TaxID=765440 RepID=A0A0C3BRY1_PILCF|nr:hypothetical protein PILCRDRAFT_219284 [Piloderma croceum F 1598]
MCCLGFGAKEGPCTFLCHGIIPPIDVFNAREQNLSYDDKTKKMISTISTRSPYSAVDILHSNRYDLSAINTVMLSHCHFDHVGDFTTFEPSTALYLGPISHSDKPILSDIARALQVDEAKLAKHRIEFMSDVHKDRWIDVGCLKGVDYWGNGSFYILSTPGVSRFQAT